MKIPPVGAELFHMDRQTDMTKVIVAFLNFGNAPELIDAHELKKNQSLGNKKYNRNEMSCILRTLKVYITGQK
jgi:hypothetical protein